MSRLKQFVLPILIVCIIGCNSDIVCTSRLKKLEQKCFYIAPIQSENPYVGTVLSDAVEKEFIRRKLEICRPETATVFITGSTFMTVRSKNSEGFGPKNVLSNQAIESVSVVAKDKAGQILLSATYDNKEQYTVSRLAKEFGAALAGKFK